MLNTQYSEGKKAGLNLAVAIVAVAMVVRVKLVAQNELLSQYLIQLLQCHQYIRV